MLFLEPSALALLTTLPFVAVFLTWRERLRRRRRERIGDIHLIGSLIPAFRPNFRFWHQVLWILALTALILALARPVWGLQVEPIGSEGVSIMIVLDVSRSMDTQDIAPSRLERAKLGLRDLLAALDGDEVGLILFAGDAVMQFPLTTDLRSADLFLSRATSSAFTRQGTAIDIALRLALDSISWSRGASRFIILVSDGEGHEGDPLAVAAEAAAQNVTIHTLGYGTIEGAPVPMLDAAGSIIGYRTDDVGTPVQSRLNETLLQAIAERTGGLYQRGTGDSSEIVRLIESLPVAPGGTLASSVRERPVERFGLFVALALLFLSLEILLPQTRRIPV
jgi:Ca-activated chloride channel family protein